MIFADATPGTPSAAADKPHYDASALPLYESEPECDRDERRRRSQRAEHAAAIAELMEYEQNMPSVPHRTEIPNNNNNAIAPTQPAPQLPQSNNDIHKDANSNTNGNSNCNNTNNTAATAVASSSSPRPSCAHSCCSHACPRDDANAAQTAEYALLDEPMLPQHALVEPHSHAHTHHHNHSHSHGDCQHHNQNHSHSHGDCHHHSHQRPFVVPKKLQPAAPKASSDDLRANIVAISTDPALTPLERDTARQRLYTSGYSTRKSAEAIAYARECERNKHTPSYSQYKDGAGRQLLGCVHYARNCKIQAPCCGIWVVCRHCHDVACITPDHSIDRFAIQKILCMVCNTEQDIAHYCANSSCGVKFADYYCYQCRFFDNAPGKEIYHCGKCKICRVGKGLGRDNYHCDHCNACVSLTPDGKDSHRCLQASLDADCPICGDYMLTSTTQVVFMQCGHAMHHTCFDEYTATNYVCPICAKTLTDMSPYYRQIDTAIEQQPLPDEYARRKVEIRCHNCDVRCITNFHFIYLKCIQCNGYNTRLIRDRDEDEEIRVLAADG